MRKIPLLFVIFAFSFVSAFSQGVIAEIMKRVGQHQKALTSFRADIKISKFSAQSGETYTKEGVVKFAPQVSDYLLRIDSTKPVPESFSIIKNQYLFYQPNLNLIYLPDVKIAYTGRQTDSQKNTFAIFSILSKENLKANYSPIKYVGQENVNGTIPTWHLELTPKTAKSFNSIDIWIDGSGMPIQSKVTEKNGDWTSILFGKLEKNVSIPAANFQIELPKGIKLFKN